MELLDGKKTAADIKTEITAEVNKMKANKEKVPHLAAIIVGNDGASLTYVGSKVKACELVGMKATNKERLLNGCSLAYSEKEFAYMTQQYHDLAAKFRKLAE